MPYNCVQINDYYQIEIANWNYKIVNESLVLRIANWISNRLQMIQTINYLKQYNWLKKGLISELNNSTWIDMS